MVVVFLYRPVARPDSATPLISFALINPVPENERTPPLPTTKPVVLVPLATPEKFTEVAVAALPPTLHDAQVPVRFVMTPLAGVPRMGATKVCCPDHVFACPNASDATTAPVVGLMVNVPSLLDTEDTAPDPAFASTKAVVAIWVVLVPTVAVGAVGTPVRAGDASGAFAFNCVCTELVASINAIVAALTPLVEVGVMAPKVRVIAGVVVAVATVPDTPLAVVTDTVVTVPEPPPMMAHPVALPFARTPVGALPVVQSVGVAAKAVAVAALPVVLWLNVGKLVRLAALNVGAV